MVVILYIVANSPWPILPAECTYSNLLTICSIDSTCGYYRFDVHEDTNDGEQMIQAELLLLQKNSPTLAGDYNVDIYYMLSESHWSPLPISFKRIDSTSGWKKFDITPNVT